jgi:predicted nucleic acid-binding protein
MIVLDASVILKWFLIEEGRDIALMILDRHVDEDEQIAIPELLYYEFGNIMALKAELSEDKVIESIAFLFGFNLKVISLSQQEYIGAIRLSRLYKISVYDASYIVLAKSLNVNFVTADEKLAQKMKDMSFVQTLKDYSNK